MRSGPGEARTILLLHIINARPSKQPLMVRTFLKVYIELGSYFVSTRTNKRHHHHHLLSLSRMLSRIPRVLWHGHVIGHARALSRPPVPPKTAGWRGPIAAEEERLRRAADAKV